MNLNTINPCQMRRHLFTLLLCFGLLGTSSLLHAQNTTQKWALGVGGISLRDASGVPFGDFGGPGDAGYALQFSIGRNINRSLNLTLNAGIPFSAQESRDNNDLTDFDLAFNLRMLDEDIRFSPYLIAGIGTNFLDFDDIDLNWHIPVGGGVRWDLDDVISLDLNATYKPSISDFVDYMTVNGGIIARLGRAKPKDKDKDGTPDIEDPCPLIAGPLATKGCPDQDNDLVADKDDACPATPGKLNGCPDTDNDRIADKDDNCPEIAGLAQFNGCPDTDADGIMDSEDDCPRVAGLAKFQGCPDADGDGIMDKEDKCPGVAGLAEFNGCPDSDGDGVVDQEDECPGLAGVAALKGCPDKDGDGIADKDDRCPEQAGVERLLGCPELKEEVVEKLERATRSVKFASGRATLLSRSYRVLNEVVELMKEYPQYKLKLSGYTDSTGDDAKNLDLSKRRAKACLDYLADKGIGANRMTSDGFGEANPIASNRTSSGRAENRRVEFELFVD